MISDETQAALDKVFAELAEIPDERWKELELFAPCKVRPTPYVEFTGWAHPTVAPPERPDD